LKKNKKKFFYSKYILYICIVIDFNPLNKQQKMETMEEQKTRKRMDELSPSTREFVKNELKFLAQEYESASREIGYDSWGVENFIEQVKCLQEYANKVIKRLEE
jgi:hypothetical protein